MNFSKEELQILKSALRDRESRMFKDAQTYRDQGNKLAQFDCIQEMRLAQHLSERIHKALSYPEKENEMLSTVQQFGEDEGDCGHRIWLSDLDGQCNINSHTDIMSVVACKTLLGNDSLSFQVNTPDDKSTMFVDLYEFEPDVVEAIYSQVMSHKK